MGQKFLRIGKIIKFTDNHNGLLGDGNTYVVIQYTKDEFIKILSPIKSGVSWKKMPIAKEILLIPGISNTDNHHFLNNHFLPVSKKSGVYYFIDSQIEGADNKELLKKPIYKRNSFNYTLAILDSNTKRLYLFREDT